MKSVSYYAKSYFTFSKGERKGILALLIILTVIVSIIVLLPRRDSPRNTEKFLAMQREIDSLFIQPDTGKSLNQQNRSSRSNKSASQLYKKKYGEIELNSCDSVAFEGLPGLGPVLAARIIKYRNLLGGFYQVDQLREVYGLKEENLLKAKPYIKIDKTSIRLIDLDTTGFKTLARHPYIGKERAWKIINLREKLNVPNVLTDAVRNAGIFDSTQWTRVKPYLVLKNSPLQIE